MRQLFSIEPIDYLMVGHLTLDKFGDRYRLGGTATYAGLTAAALGLRVGIVTSWGEEIEESRLGSIPIINNKSEHSTIFENLETPYGRVQRILKVAPGIELYQIPETWRTASIVHLGPVAQEIDLTLIRQFPAALIGVTPQGWLREWDREGKVSTTDWLEASFVLERAGAAVISLEDVDGDEERLEKMAAACPVLAVTEGSQGVRLYWNGDVRRFTPPPVTVVDSTGAGDIFAAAFFVRMLTTRDPWEAARFAAQLAAISVTRHGLDGIPTTDEVNSCLVEVF